MLSPAGAATGERMSREPINILSPCPFLVDFLSALAGYVNAREEEKEKRHQGQAA